MATAKKKSNASQETPIKVKDSLSSLAQIGALMTELPKLTDLAGPEAADGIKNLVSLMDLAVTLQWGSKSSERFNPALVEKALNGASMAEKNSGTFRSDVKEQLSALTGEHAATLTLIEKLFNRGEPIKSIKQARQGFPQERIDQIASSLARPIGGEPAALNPQEAQKVAHELARQAQNYAMLTIEQRNAIKSHKESLEDIYWMWDVRLPAQKKELIIELARDHAKTAKSLAEVSWDQEPLRLLGKACSHQAQSAERFIQSREPGEQELAIKARSAFVEGGIGSAVARGQRFEATWSSTALARLEASDKWSAAFVRMINGNAEPIRPKMSKEDASLIKNLRACAALAENGLESGIDINRARREMEALKDARWGERQTENARWRAETNLQHHGAIALFKAAFELGGRWIELSEDALMKASGIKSYEDKDGQALQEIAGACHARNPSLALSRGNASARLAKAFSAGDSGVVFAGQEELEELTRLTESYQEKALRATCAASICYMKKKTKGDLMVEIATQAAMGYAEIEESSTPEDFFPESWEKAFPKKSSEETEPTWKASDELAADPMAPMAEALVKSKISDLPSGLAAVGEAKQALVSKLGLSSAAWKALSANPALRDSFAKMLSAANPDLHKSEGRIYQGGSASKRFQRAVEAADAASESLWGSLAKLSAKQTGLAHAKAAALIATAGAAYHIDAPTQVFLLEWSMSNPLASAMLGGRIPLPREFWQFSAKDPNDLRQLALDAKAWEEKLPLVVKGLAAKVKRVGLEGAATECHNILSDICDVASQMQAGFFSGLDAKAPLEHAKRLHDDWARQNQQAQQLNQSGGEKRRWEKLMEQPMASEHMLEARELGNGAELFEEGKRMHHCVASYASACAQGSSRIFSITRGGAKLSTLELAPFNSKGERLHQLNFSDIDERKKVSGWRIVQNRGNHNCSITEEKALAFCQSVAKEAMKAFEAKTQEMMIKEEQLRKERMAKMGALKM